MSRLAIVSLSLAGACAGPATTQAVAEEPQPADRREEWELAPTRARPCWAFERSKHFELVCDVAANPFSKDEEGWIAAIDADAGFEIPLDSPAYPIDVRPGMELTLITARGLVRRTVRGVSGQWTVKDDGEDGLRYTIRLEGPPVGPALAVGDVQPSAVLAEVAMARSGPTPLRKAFEDAMLEARSNEDLDPVFDTATRVVDASTWTDPLDLSMGTFLAVTDSLQPPDDESVEYGGLGYVLRPDGPIQWIVAPEYGVDEVSVAHAVDLDGDGTHELIVHASYETSEEILLVRRRAPGFEVQQIYWAGC